MRLAPGALRNKKLFNKIVEVHTLRILALYLKMIKYYIT